MTQRKRTIFAILAATALVVTGACKHNETDAVEIHRFEKVLFETPVEQLQSRLIETGNEYATDLLNVQPYNPEFMQVLAGFVQDGVMQDVYHVTDSVFGDMKSQAAELGKALARAEKLHPMMRYDKVYTFVSGMMNYDMRVGVNTHELVISLDQYVLPYLERYNYFNTPLYLVKQSRPEYMISDCMQAIAREFIEIPQSGEMTMLDYMVAEGKAIYFAQQTLDKVEDSILMRYTAEQMDWMKKNEKNVWTYLLQNKVLYDADFMRFHNLIDEAPKTNAFNESAPRTPYYIGWRIVSLYAEKTGCSMQELLSETNSQMILSQSNYRPQ